MNDIYRPMVSITTAYMRRGKSLSAWLREQGRDDIRVIETRNRCIWRPSYEYATAPVAITVRDTDRLAAD